MVKHNEKIPLKVYAGIIATGLMSFCGVLVETAMNVSFPTLMRDFNVSTNVVQWMTSIALLTVSIIVPISAALKRSYPARSLFLAANLAFLTGLVIDASAPNFGLLLGGRVIQGIGTGIALPLMFNIILDQIPKQQIGLMMGFGNMITGIAPALGPTFGGIVIQRWGWRWVFLLLVPVVLISLALGLWGIPRDDGHHRMAVDQPSFLAITLFFSGMTVAFSNLGTGNILTVGLPLIGAITAGRFLVWRSTKLPVPILKLTLGYNAL